MPAHVSQRISPEPIVEAATRGSSAAARVRPAVVPVAEPARPLQPRDSSSLHISKLRGIGVETRSKLKRQGITYTDQLLERAGAATARQRLAASCGIPEEELLRLARRADLARIKGIGAIFADMLELIGIQDVGALAEQDPSALHRQLYRLNAAERFARRAPTPDEVTDWVQQARRAPRLLDSDDG